MVNGWVKSLQCKSRAFDDVYHPSPKLLMPSKSCRRSSHSIKDVIQTRERRKNPDPDLSSRYLRPCTPEPDSNPPNRPRRSASARHPDPYLPELTELPEGLPSRNVVEIIFLSSWSPTEFSGRVERIFRVESGSRTVARYEDYRDAVKSRAGACAEHTESSAWEENARCIADGNEMMRFYPLGLIPGICGGAWAFPGGKGASICTFSGGGEAHAKGGGGGRRRGVLICRVIAGRVGNKIDVSDVLFPDGRFDSVTGHDGELLVFDTRAVLPCFLIIYKL